MSSEAAPGCPASKTTQTRPLPHLLHPRRRRLALLATPSRRPPTQPQNAAALVTRQHRAFVLLRCLYLLSPRFACCNSFFRAHSSCSSSSLPAKRHRRFQEEVLAAGVSVARSLPSPDFGSSHAWPLRRTRRRRAGRTARERCMHEVRRLILPSAFAGVARRAAAASRSSSVRVSPGLESQNAADLARHDAARERLARRSDLLSLRSRKGLLPTQPPLPS